jgi:hypothetical protein
MKQPLYTNNSDQGSSPGFAVIPCFFILIVNKRVLSVVTPEEGTWLLLFLFMYIIYLLCT